MKQEKIVIGTFVKPRGLKGELIALSYTENSKDFLEYEDYFVKTAAGFEKLKVTHKQHYKGNRFVLRLDQVNHIDQSEHYVNQDIYISSTDLEDLKEDEFYYYEAAGADVYRGNELLGTVLRVANFGSCDILEVVLKDSKKQVYLPILSEYLESFDLKNKKIVYLEIDDLF